MTDSKPELPPMPAIPPVGPPAPPPVGPPAPPSEPARGGRLGTAALVLGIVALVLAFIPAGSVLGIVVALVAIVLGVVALVRRTTRKGRAITGTGLGGLALVIAIVMTILYAFVFALAGLGSAIVSGPPSGTTATATPAPSMSPTQTAPAEQTPAPTAEAGTVARQTFSGTTDSVLDVDLAERPAVVRFACENCDGNTVLQTNGAEALLVNTIGPWRGVYLVDMTDTAETSTLTVTAKGDWSITVEDLSELKQTDGPAKGTGDSVVHFVNDFDRAAITGTGEGNFILIGYGGLIPNLAVNTIGAYDGTVPLDGPGYVQVTSTGDWTITPG